jgi:NitT/TauT family transport system permease protein
MDTALMIRTSASLLANIMGILLFLAAWQVAGATLGDALLAPPLHVAVTLRDTLLSPDLRTAITGLLGHMLLGYALSMAIGIPLGVAMGRFSLVRHIVKPWAQTAVVISAAALVPLFIILFGRGLLLSVAIVFVSTVWFVALTMMEAARNVHPKALAVARSFGASPLQRFRWVIVPALFPYVLVSARIALVQGLRAVVTAQMFISSGFGGLINDAGLNISTSALLGLLVILMLISITLSGILQFSSNRLAPWYAAALERP